MRLIEVARALGMTGQELRRELQQVDFGVRPTDREVPDRLAQGIIRFIAEKHDIAVRDARPGAAGSRRAESGMRDGEGAEERADGVPSVKEEQTPRGGDEGEKEGNADSPPPSPHPAASRPSQKVHVLRKLSLEGVSEEAVRAQQAIHPPLQSPRVLSKEEREALLEEEKAQALPKKRKFEQQEQIKRKEGVVELPETITVKEFAEKTGVQVPEVISMLMKNGVLATINQTIDFDSASIVASELGVTVRKEQATASAAELIAGNLEELLREDDPSLLRPRGPIVTVMGHVDHGKTAILDAIRQSDVVSGEAGGITQKIGAYGVERDGGTITFLDTPGHEAFAAMRARGAQITDIVVLVVAADEGVKATTIEAMDHSKDAGVPILVAINKIDAGRADPDRVKGELAQHGLQPEEWGGDAQVVLCSARTGRGIDDLLDRILLLAQMAELRANPDRPAIATVIESHLDPSLGPVVSVIVNAGTLRTGDAFVCGAAVGKVKSMVLSTLERAGSVGPSGAARLSGISAVPEAGDILQVVADEREAKRLRAEVMAIRERHRRRGIGDLISRLSEGKLMTLKVVLKADAQGSLEAIGQSIGKLRTERGVRAKVIHSAVGGITESDVMMAAASGGIVLGFDVPVSTHVERVAALHGVDVRLYDVIYELLSDVGGLLEGLVEPVESERVLGHLDVRGTFYRKKSDQVIGGIVTDGTLKRVPFRILRGEAAVGTGRITSLRHVERDVKEAKEGKEYGLRVDCETVIGEGDVIEAFVKEFRKREK